MGRAMTGTDALLGRSQTALLTTYRSSGEAVTTPVSLAVDSGPAYFVTAADSGKAKRLARCDQVVPTPCTVGGTPIAAGIGGRVRLMTDSAPRKWWLLRPTRALFWSWLLYRLRGHSMRLYEVTPDAPRST